MNAFAEGSFDLGAQRSHSFEDRSKGAVCSTVLEKAVGQHLQVPVATGTCGMPELAVSKTNILLSVPEECPHSPSHRVQLDEMARWRIDFVREDAFHARFFALFAGFFLRGQDLHFTETAYIVFLRPDVGEFAVDRARGCVDALAERIDTDLLSPVGDACVAFDG